MLRRFYLYFLHFRTNIVHNYLSCNKTSASPKAKHSLPIYYLLCCFQKETQPNFIVLIKQRNLDHCSVLRGNSCVYCMIDSCAQYLCGNGENMIQLYNTGAYVFQGRQIIKEEAVAQEYRKYTIQCHIMVHNNQNLPCDFSGYTQHNKQWFSVNKQFIFCNLPNSYIYLAHLEVDSLNVTIAAGIAMFCFTRKG